MQKIILTIVKTFSLSILLYFGHNLRAQDAPIVFKSELEVIGDVKIDSTLVEELKEYEAYSNKYDQSKFFLPIQNSYYISSIGWAWLKVLSRERITLDTLLYANKKLPKSIKKILVLNDTTLSVTRDGGSELVTFTNGQLATMENSGFCPPQKDKRFKKDENWLSISANYSNTILALREKRGKSSTWDFIHINEKNEWNSFFTSCETSRDYPFDLMLSKSLYIQDNKFQSYLPDCGEFLVYDISSNTLKKIGFGDTESNLNRVSIYLDTQKDKYYKISLNEDSLSLFKLQEVKIIDDEFVATGEVYFFMLPKLYFIQGVVGGNLQLISLSGSETIHYLIPLQDLLESDSLKEKLLRLQEIVVDGLRN